MMKPFLVNAPGLSVMTPSGNQYISVVASSGVITQITAAVVTDPTMKVDNYDAVISITLSVVITQGTSSSTDIINIMGSSVSTTINGFSLILMGDINQGTQSVATIMSCGQTSSIID